MKVEQTSLSGVLVLTPKIIEDSRGFFQETYNQKLFHELGIKDDFVQDNHSLSKTKNILRGLHYQSGEMAQSKLIRVLRGSILDVIVDINPRSPTFKKHFKFVLDDKKFQQIYVPRGYAHGFVTLEDDTQVAYKVDNFYSGPHSTGIIWNDPDLGIDWGCSEPILSEQDTKLPTLKTTLSKT